MFFFFNLECTFVSICGLCDGEYNTVQDNLNSPRSHDGYIYGYIFYVA